MAKICGIYKITGPTGRVYIGQSVDVVGRFGHYKRFDCKRQTKLYNSFKKYGIDKHKFEILHQCEPEQLNELEIYYIELFQSFNTKHGMNLQKGGGNRSPSEETRRKIREANRGERHYNYGKHLSEEHKKKLSEANKGKMLSEETKRKVSMAGKGRKHLEETKQKISEAQQRRWRYYAKNVINKLHHEISKETIH